MEQNRYESLFKVFAKTVAFAASILVLLWILYKAAYVVLILLLALVLSLVLIGPVSMLEKKGMKRGWASMIVFGLIFLIIAALCWMILPKVYYQLQHLLTSLPLLIDSLSTNISSWFNKYPELSIEIKEEANNLSRWLPSTPQALRSISRYSFSLFSFLFLMIIFAWIIIYTVVNPKPLVETYYSLFAYEKRDKAQNALIHISSMLQGWIKANIIGGSIEAICITTFLSILNVPGAWIWGAVALFAELIPHIGFYIMAIPPILVALSVSPITALWVLIFFLILSEIMADIVMPRLRSSTMNIHPASTLFMLLIMGATFGVWGALLTVPVTAIIKAYYEEFYLSKHEDKEMEERVNKIVY